MVVGLVKDNDFINLVEKFQKPIFKFLYGFGIRSDDVEDLAQSVFLKVYQSFESYSPDQSQWSTWIYTIAKNEAINHLRKQKIITFFKKNQEVCTDESPAYLLFEGLEDIEFRKQVLSHIQNLKDPYKATLILFYYNELSMEEISAIEKCSLGTVKSRLSRAKSELKKKLPRELYV